MFVDAQKKILNRVLLNKIDGARESVGALCSGKADFTQLDCYAIAAWLALKISKRQAVW